MNQLTGLLPGSPSILRLIDLHIKWPNLACRTKFGHLIHKANNIERARATVKDPTEKHRANSYPDRCAR